MDIQFKPVDIHNFTACVNMQAGAGQPWVAANVFSIAQSKVEPDLLPFGIYAGEMLVGFIMYAMRRDQQELYLCRFMLDEQYQRRGYGKASLELLKEIALGEPEVRRITLSTDPANTHGIKVYTRFGFVATGAMHGNEAEFELIL